MSFGIRTNHAEYAIRLDNVGKIVPADQIAMEADLALFSGATAHKVGGSDAKLLGSYENQI